MTVMTSYLKEKATWVTQIPYWEQWEPKGRRRKELWELRGTVGTEELRGKNCDSTIPGSLAHRQSESVKPGQYHRRAWHNNTEEYNCVTRRKRSGTGDYSKQDQPDPDKYICLKWKSHGMCFTTRNKAKRKELQRELRTRTPKPDNPSWIPKIHTMEG